MADLGEAYNILKKHTKTFQTIDFFFTQRTLTEDQEYIDANMNRLIKKIKVTHNFLALNIPTIAGSLLGNNENQDKLEGFYIRIYGDNGYHYEGNIPSFEGIVPNFMIPVKGDKKIFIHLNYKFKDYNNNIINKEFVNFIDVPKRFQDEIEL
jgi:hypothetical protein